MMNLYKIIIKQPEDLAVFLLLQFALRYFDLEVLKINIVIHTVTMFAQRIAFPINYLALFIVGPGTYKVKQNYNSNHKVERLNYEK